MQKENIRYGLTRSEDKRNHLEEAYWDTNEATLNWEPLSNRLLYFHTGKHYQGSNEWLYQVEAAYADQHHLDYEEHMYLYDNYREGELWEERALELRYRGPYCDQIPFGDEAFDAVVKDKERYEEDLYYSCYCHSHYEHLEYQINIYERHGLVPEDEEIKPIKERELICFPWQGVTSYTKH